MQPKCFSVIIAGGKGTRFWPLSRSQRPKQLLKILGRRSLISETTSRVLSISGSKQTLVVTVAEQLNALCKELPNLPRKNFLAEPQGNNTAPCIGLAALEVVARDPRAVMVILPADHWVADVSGFRSSIKSAVEIATRHDSLVTIGIRLLELVRSRSRARHPQTVEARLTVGGKERVLYLKIFHSTQGLSVLKDLLRHSKAFRFWRQGVALRESGFHVPVTVAVGEQRRFRFVQRAFVLTESIEGQALPDFLARREAGCADSRGLARKWEGIRVFGGLVRRFHQLGFVHGDMVASNILVGESARDRIKFYLMDNDRTRRFPLWFPQSLWRRNLVQLNRMPLPTISLQDRMRFLHAYLDARKLSVAERKLARWLELKTRQRRKECDGADPSMNFRRLMRWSPDLAAPDVYTKNSARSF